MCRLALDDATYVLRADYDDGWGSRVLGIKVPDPARSWRCDRRCRCIVVLSVSSLLLLLLLLLLLIRLLLLALLLLGSSIARSSAGQRR